MIRRLNALSAGLKSRLGDLTFAETPPSAISRFTCSPESSEARPLFKAPGEEMVPRSVRIWSKSTSNERPFMKFVSLGTERTHQRSSFDEPSRGTLESLTKPIAMSHQIDNYSDLWQQIHHNSPLQRRDVISQRPRSFFTRVMQLTAIIVALGFLWLWFSVSTHHAPRPSYPYYDTQKPVPPWSEPTPLEGNHDRGGGYR